MFVDRLPRGAPLRGEPISSDTLARADGAVFPILVVFTLLIAAGLGLSSAFWMTKGDYPFGSVRAGAWTVWPRAGSREADPYTRAVIARAGDIPLGVGEGLVMRATEDDAGRSLDALCTYRVGPSAPQARSWTLTLYDETGRPVDTPLGRSSFSSAEVLRDASGGAIITISPEAASGNWLMMPQRGRVRLVMRLYDSPASAGSAALDRRTVPGIERVGCQQ